MLCLHFWRAAMSSIFSNSLHRQSSGAFLQAMIQLCKNYARQWWGLVMMEVSDEGLDHHWFKHASVNFSDP